MKGDRVMTYTPQRRHIPAKVARRIIVNQDKYCLGEYDAIKEAFSHYCDANKAIYAAWCYDEYREFAPQVYREKYRDFDKYPLDADYVSAVAGARARGGRGGGEMNLYGKLRKLFHAEPFPEERRGAPAGTPTTPEKAPETAARISHAPIDFSRVLERSGAFRRYDSAADMARLNKLLLPLSLRVDRAEQGATTVTYAINLDVDTNVSKLLRMSNNFAVAINDSSARIYQDGAALLIEKKGEPNAVRMGDMYQDGFTNSRNGLLLAMGKNTRNEPVYYDLTEAPHMLVAGTTGSGKSVFLHDVICSLLMNHPGNVEIVGIDMKGTEFIAYMDAGSFTYISETRDAVSVLADLCQEMDARYKVISAAGHRDIAAYNAGAEKPLKPVVCIIDEFADLMLTSRKAVESHVVRLAQKARACGIHLVIATQRPTANVITGLIKTNIPTRVSFKVTSVIDSRIILDRKGAERLNGHGDMLLIRNGDYEPTRIQAPLMDEREIRMVAIMAGG